jgi:hypothetical protein
MVFVVHHQSSTTPSLNLFGVVCRLLVIMAPAKTAALKRAAQTPSVGLRHSTRVESNHAEALKIKEAERVAKIVPIVSFADKLRDGRELQRHKGSLKYALQYEGEYPGGGTVYHSTNDPKVRDRVNGLKKTARGGGKPCYDVIDELGSSLYGYSLPVSLMVGLLQGCKSEASVAGFKDQCKPLDSHAGTDYMFLHWRGGKEVTKGDYKGHGFAKARPDLVNSIESLGNYISEEILLNKELGAVKQPGMLANRLKMDELDFQTPHWDFPEWRPVKGEDLPYIVHVPLVKEGMMVHIWPTARDEATHSHHDVEDFKLGKPKLVHVAFGDYLMLRADVCHGGCFGSKGNMRFHMVLRKKSCKLNNLNLHYLARSGVEKSDFQQKSEELRQLLGKNGDYFNAEAARKCKTVTPYVTSLKKVYPNLPDFCGKDGLLDLLPYD